MLRIRPLKLALQTDWREVLPGAILGGLSEDVDYVIRSDGVFGTRLFIDDVEIKATTVGEYQWRPCFYSGKVLVEVTSVGDGHQKYWLVVGPTSKKSGESQFAEMVDAIREFDSTLLGGESAATMAFGNQGQTGLFSIDILLARVRAHGSIFLDAVDVISRKPHLSITRDSQVLPLSRIRKLHPSALRDRRLAVLTSGKSVQDDSMQTIQLRGATSSATFDTAANQTLLALLKRFRSAVQMLRNRVEDRTLGISTEEQETRAERRLIVLDKLASRTDKLITGSPFVSVTKAQTTSSGLTQIAAHPIYSRAYRMGSQSLILGVEGIAHSDDLHVNYSWGIYETWCYLSVIRCVGELLGCEKALVASPPRAVSAELAFSVNLDSTRSLEILFQANFPSMNPSAGRLGCSISRMRIPDIVLVERCLGEVRAMVLDSKWRSGRDNVFDAMQSAHIYHDSLRLDSKAPNLCVLLLPGESMIPELEKLTYITEHGVGAISDFNVGAAGIDRLKLMIGTWLANERGETSSGRG